jgi:hypothetical protein
MILTGRGADMAQHRGGFKVKMASPPRTGVPRAQKIPLSGMIRFNVSRAPRSSRDPPKTRSHVLQ